MPGSAAIASAIYDATGARVRELPITPERVPAGARIARGDPGIVTIGHSRGGNARQLIGS